MKNDFIGKWRIHTAYRFTKDGPAELTRDQLLEEEDGRDLYDMILEFTEDGKANTISRIPEGMPQEKIDEAIRQGMEVRDGFIIVDSLSWKIEDGKFMYDSGEKMTCNGEEVSSWVELTIEDGLLNFLGMFKMEKF